MATKLGIGTSTTLDSFTAGREAAQKAYYQLKSPEADIIITFISTIFDQKEVIRGIRSIIKGVSIVGCSSIGTITTSGSITSSVCVSLINSNNISFSYAVEKDIDKNPRTAGRNVAYATSHSKNFTRQFYIMFFDGLSGNGVEILRGTQEVLGTSFPIIGGAGTDGVLFKKTYQYWDDNIYTNSLLGLLISGNITISIGKAHGLQPIGKPHKVTKSNANIIKEIDKKRATRLYEEYTGKSFDELNTEGFANLGLMYPLGVLLRGKKEYIIRTPLGTNDSGELILNAEISEQEEINLMIGDKNLVLDATRKACEEALKNIKKSNIKFAIVFSNISRLHLLRKDSGNEVKIIKEMLGTDVPLFGCYTLGEYAFVDTQGFKKQGLFNNQTISVSLFAE